MAHGASKKYLPIYFRSKYVNPSFVFSINKDELVSANVENRSERKIVNSCSSQL